MNNFLLAVSLCCGVGKNLLSKAGEQSFSGLRGLMRANMVTAALAICFFAWQSIGAPQNGLGLLVILAVCYGIFTLGSQSLYILAVKQGSVSICSLIYSSSFLLPTIYSVFRFSETVTLSKAMGIALMLLAILLVSKSKGSPARTGRTQVVYALLAMLCAGLVGVLQKEFGTRFLPEQLPVFLCVAFLTMLVCSLLLDLGAARHGQAAPPLNAAFWLPALLLGLCVTVANQLNTFLASALPGILFFPVLNGGCILFSALLSAIIFHEHIPLRTWLGISVGIGAIVCIAV